MKSGDRYQHQKWAAGTPDAVIGKVEDGVVFWSELGGSQVSCIAVRRLIPELGWRKVS